MTRTIYAAPEMREVKDVHGNKSWWFDLQTALLRARPGDTVELMPGRYTSSVICGISGEAKKPITIRGADGGTVLLDGQQPREAGRHGGMDPMDGDFAFIKIVQAKHIVFENLHFANCWPCSIFMRSAQHIQIRNCKGLGSRYFVYARQTAFAPTRNILIEGTCWVQDPDHEMWQGSITWKQVKAKPGKYDASFFNGGFFGSFDIDGDLVIRDCEISHAFNGIRMDIRKTHKEDEDSILSIRRNCNVSVYRNKFAFIRDNAIEPEMGAANWRIFNNHFFNNHAALSIDGVAMEDFFFVANWILNNRRPGAAGQKNTGGKVIKFLGLPEDTANCPVSERKNFWTMFNSVQTRTLYGGNGRTAEWNDACNVVGLYPVDYPSDHSKVRHLFEKLAWNDRMQVLGMATSDRQFPAGYSNCNGVGGIERPLAVEEFKIDEAHPLGGWNGELVKSEQVMKMRSNEIVIEPRTGPPIVIDAGLPPGAKPIERLGLKEWTLSP